MVWAAHWLSHLSFSWESPVWRRWTAEFAKDHCFILYDERGSGLSDWDDLEFSIDAFVRDLEAVVDTLGICAIANEHGVYLRTPDPQKVRITSELINCGMPLTHVAQRVGFNIQTLRRILRRRDFMCAPCPLHYARPPSGLWQARTFREEHRS